MLSVTVAPYSYFRISELSGYGAGNRAPRFYELCFEHHAAGGGQDQVVVDYVVDVIKDRGALARVVGRGEVENVYRMQITNGSEQPQHYRIAVHGLEGLAIVSGDELRVEATGIGTLPLRLTLPPEGAEAHRGKSHPIVFEVSTAQEGVAKTARVKSTFLVPR